MLSSDRPAKLLELARNEADFIIVDTPPSSILSDAATIVESVDAGILVIRQDYAPVDRILEGIQLLSETGLRIVGCVLNNVDTGIVAGYGRYSHFGYGYGYGYGRYSRYGYGYGSKITNSKDGHSADAQENREKRTPFSPAEEEPEEKTDQAPSVPDTSASGNEASETE